MTDNEDPFDQAVRVTSRGALAASMMAANFHGDRDGLADRLDRLGSVCLDHAARNFAGAIHFKDTSDPQEIDEHVDALADVFRDQIVEQLTAFRAFVKATEEGGGPET